MPQRYAIGKHKSTNTRNPFSVRGHMLGECVSPKKTGRYWRRSFQQDGGKCRGSRVQSSGCAGFRHPTCCPKCVLLLPSHQQSRACARRATDTRGGQWKRFLPYDRPKSANPLMGARCVHEHSRVVRTEPLRIWKLHRLNSCL